MNTKKRKVDNENRKFLTEWTEQYCNLKRHYETTHQQFHKNFPLGTEAHQEKIQSCLASYKRLQRFFLGLCTAILVHSLSEQEKSAEASLRVCWTLNKHQKPFSNSEIMKKCMLEIATALFEEKRDVVANPRYSIIGKKQCNKNRNFGC